MHRIDTSTAQKDKFGAGKNGFTNGDPSTGRRATDLNSDMWDAVQEEMATVIEGAGIALDKSRHDQLALAIRAIISEKALQRENNLSDLTDGAKARENLGIDRVGNWPAVQQGGGKGMLDNKALIGWTGKKLIAQVDNTPMGEIFYKNNPPTKDDVGLDQVGNYRAYPATGGKLDEESSVEVTTNARSVRNGDTIYSPMFRALIKGRGGDRDFKDGASGVFRLVEVVGKEAFIEVLFDGFGSVHSFRFHQDGGLRVPGRLVAEGASLTQPVISTHADAFRIITGNKGTFWRFDGESVYLMMTSENDANGGWNGLRPFCVSWKTGVVTLGNGLTVNANVKFEAGGRGHVYQIDGNIVESAGSGIFRGYWNATSLDGALRNITNRADDAWNKANDAQVNRVQDMRLGGLESSQVWNAQGYSDQPPYVITGVHNFNNDAVIDIIYRRPLQKFVNGGWHNVSGI